MKDNRGDIPLMIYLRKDHYLDVEIVDMFLKAGTDGSICNNEGMTILHQACLQYQDSSKREKDVKVKIIEMVVKAGSLSNFPGIRIAIPAAQNAITRNVMISPLSFLIEKKEWELCNLLIRAGYDLTNDASYSEILQKQSDNTKSMIDDQRASILGLQSRCRLVIRGALNGRKIQAKLERVPLPKKLITFLRDIEYQNCTF